MNEIKNLISFTFLPILDSKEGIMNNHSSIEFLYQKIKSKHGKTTAKKAVTAILSNILDDLEEEGLEVSESNISSRLSEVVKDFDQAIKTEVA